MSAQPKHPIWVLARDGTPLTPTTPAKARRLLKAGVAEARWSKFGTFGIQLLTDTRQEVPHTTMGADQGTKYEGYSVLCGTENALNVKMDLPDKKRVVRKLRQRRQLRQNRRDRLRCRARRGQNRCHAGFLAPGQQLLLHARMTVMGELLHMYPIQVIAYEDVFFDLDPKKRTTDFSTVEIGRQRLRQWIAAYGIPVVDFSGMDTKTFRDYYAYKKCKNKAADRFESHCCDSLTLAVAVHEIPPVTPGPFLIVEKSYSRNRRQLHDINTPKGGVRAAYRRGTVMGYRKGLVLGLKKGRTGILMGEADGQMRYFDQRGKRHFVREVLWISSQFRRRPELPPIKKGSPSGSPSP